MQREGEVERGKKLFADDQRVGCSKCHTVDGSGLKAGPDLASVGDQFARRDLIDAVLMPSATIAVGYGTTVVETRSGEEFTGVLKQVTDAWVELMGGDGQRVRVAKTDILEQRGSALSLMPEGLQAGLSPQEFADLVEYLVSLKQADHALTSHRGMPENIPSLTKPIALRPLLQENLRVAPVASDAGQPTLGLVWLGQVPGHTNLFLAAHQAGRIWCLERTASAKMSVGEFADFTPEVFSARGPNGLLGMAYHPRFRENRKYYVKHQVFEAGKIATVLEERRASPDARRDSGQPPRRLLKIEAVAEHHNGGCLEFGPDGFLYVGMGDSAPNFDPQGYGQDLRLLFGKMLRIDVDRCDAGLPYAIPSDNPFVGRQDARPEIWAYGLREPWRFSFDRVTGELWVADLGQERGDEIDLVRRGENYGWNVYEGFELFSKTHQKDSAVYVPPLFATRRKQGTCIIGGQVYRGDPRSTFYGVYVFGDHQSKRIWGLTQENRSLKSVRELATSPQLVTSFAADEGGNLYVVGYQGMIYQLDFAGAQFDEPAIETAATSAGHRFACADYIQGKIFIVGADGKVEWEHPAPSCNELWVLPDGNLLFTTGHGVKEVTREKKVVFSYESKSEIYACQRLPNGNTFIGESSAGRLLEVEPSGKIAKEIRLLPEGKSGGHLYMRNARRLANGHYLVTHYGEQIVREYDGDGKVVLTIAARSGPHSVVRLPNGHTLISCGDAVKDGARVFEVDPEGKTVWEVKNGDLPGISLKFMTGLQRLPNGNTVMSNWQGHNQFGTGPHLIEVTPDKKVVWSFADHKTMRTVSSVQLLDVPGDAIHGEVWH